MKSLRKLIDIYKYEGSTALLYHLKCIIRGCIAPVFMKIIAFFIIPEKKIVFCNFAGKGYGGYPKVICDELIRRKTNVQLVWLVKDECILPDCVRKVPIDSFRALVELSTAKIWVDNCRKPSYIRKGKNQFYLQTWHGGGPCLKMIEGDALNYLSKSYIKDALNDTKMADLFISDCEWQNKLYRRAFWYTGEILNCTTPSNDVFYRDWTIIKSQVHDSFKLDDGVHIILYAPTFRNNHSTDCYDLDFTRIIETCEKKFNGRWVLFVRIHPTMSEQGSRIHYTDNIINATSYPQIEDLIIACDVLITDFSASMFLAFRWKKWAFLYASDYSEYIQKERPLYFEMNSLPASFSNSNDEIINNIYEFSQEKYYVRCNEFCEKVGFFDGGNSTEIITNRIEQELR